MSTEEKKIYTLQEVAEHNNPKDCWLIINGKVYNVTDFLDDHPGGDDPLLQATGKDATDDFEDVGHSNNARDLMKEYYIGDIDVSTLPAKTGGTRAPKTVQRTQDNSSGFFIKLLQFLVPLIILGAALLFRSYNKSV